MTKEVTDKFRLVDKMGPALVMVIIVFAISICILSISLLLNFNIDMVEEHMDECKALNLSYSLNNKKCVVAQDQEWEEIVMLSMPGVL